MYPVPACPPLLLHTQSRVHCIWRQSDRSFVPVQVSIDVLHVILVNDIARKPNKTVVDYNGHDDEAQRLVQIECTSSCVSQLEAIAMNNSSQLEIPLLVALQISINCLVSEEKSGKAVEIAGLQILVPG